MRITRYTRGAAIAAAACTTLALLSTLSASAAPADPAAPAGPGAALASDPAAAACGGLPPYNQATTDELMNGQLTIAPFAPVTIDPHKDGDINWNQNPYNDPTWQQTFQSGGWIEELVSAYLAGGPDANAYQARAEAITKGWLQHVSAGNRNAQFLICLSEGFPGQAWIDGQIASTVDWVVRNWHGAWNHGLMQELELMQIGCAYPATAFDGQALTWRKTSWNWILNSLNPESTLDGSDSAQALGPSVDSQGAVNEQATKYEMFVYDLWQQLLPRLTSCGYTLPASDLAKIEKLPAFIAAATEPDGNLVQIGDTYVLQPPKVPHPSSLVSVYSAGYVFGRSSWTPGAQYYTLRFGRGREIHGHDDHTSVTYYDRWRNLIVNAGHDGYVEDTYRTDYIQAPVGASQLIVPGDAFHASVATSLVADSVGRTSQFYEVADTAWAGVSRYRSVYVSQDPDFMLVLDRAHGASTYQQLWHLDPLLTAASVSSTEVVATATATKTAPATSLYLIRIPLPGYAIASGSTRIVKGQTNPYQGWVSEQQLQRTPADVAEMTSHGAGSADATEMLTLITATAPGTAASASVVGKAPNGAYRVRVRIGSATVTIEIQPNGSLTQIANS